MLLYEDCFIHSVHALDKLKYRKMMEEKQASKKYDRIEMLRKKQEQELKV